ncbi:MAG: hypothetical protein QNJ36_00020 [Calothrix sp. MO_167.B42]|nr:hypothetical protein [Calothrix sp. MO_167.B42]
MKSLEASMKTLMIAFSCICLSPYFALAGVSDIKGMYQTDNGNFKVMCSNKKSEIVTAQEIIDNEVCEVRKKVICKGDKFLDRFYVTRVPDGKRLNSNHMPLEMCKQITKASGRNVVCTSNAFHNRFYVTRVSNGKRLNSNHMPLEMCKQITKVSDKNVVCTSNAFHNRFYVTRVSDGKRLNSNHMSLKTCLQAIIGHGKNQ